MSPRSPKSSIGWRAKSHTVFSTHALPGRPALEDTNQAMTLGELWRLYGLFYSIFIGTDMLLRFFEKGQFIWDLDYRFSTLLNQIALYSRQ